MVIDALYLIIRTGFLRLYLHHKIVFLEIREPVLFHAPNIATYTSTSQFKLPASSDDFGVPSQAMMTINMPLKVTRSKSGRRSIFSGCCHYSHHSRVQ